MEITREMVITRVLQYAQNVGFEDFTKDFAEVIENFVSGNYAESKLIEMRDNFPHFFCNLDDEAKRRFVTVALRHYGIENN